MDGLTVTLLIANITAVVSGTVVIAKELGKLNKKLDAAEEALHSDIGVNTTRLAWELSEQKQLLNKQLTKEDIKAAVKGELAEEVRKLAFTPIKMDIKK